METLGSDFDGLEADVVTAQDDVNAFFAQTSGDDFRCNDWCTTGDATLGGLGSQLLRLEVTLLLVQMQCLLLSGAASAADTIDDCRKLSHLRVMLLIRHSLVLCGSCRWRRLLLV